MFSPHLSLGLPHGDLTLPTFLPDATWGVVRALDSQDLQQCGIQALVMNTFHLMQKPGSTTIQALGGLHRLAGWEGVIATDSGGFQAYSLIRQNPKYGSISQRGLLFRPEKDQQRKILLTPEKTIQLQMSYGSDILFCLDDCTHAEDTDANQEESVRRTVEWGKRCKAEFVRLLEQKQLDSQQRPLLFGIIQGGGSAGLRRICAEALLEIGFDGYGFGGWPLDQQGQLLTEMLEFTRQLIPRQFPLHALGVGHPASVVTCSQLGYDLFDCSLPTRDARQGRLYRFHAPPQDLDFSGDPFFDYVYVQDEKFIKASQPISPYCDALCCRHYTLAYIRHLFHLNDHLAARLATIHNLRFMSQLMKRLQELRTATS